MQTIYIEQDCMLTLQNAILEQSQKNHLVNYSNLRGLRNEAFGHPSEKKKKNGLFSRHFFDIIDDKNQILKILDWKITGDIGTYQFELTQKIRANMYIPFHGNPPVPIYGTPSFRSMVTPPVG